MQKVRLIVYPVKDISSSKALFSKFFGVEPYVDSPYYVGFRIDDQEIGLDPNAEKHGITTPIAYIDVTNIKSFMEGLIQIGAQIMQDTRDVGGGLLIATLKDINGNILGLRQMP